MTAIAMKIEDKISETSFDQMCRMYVRIFRFVTVLPFKGRDFSFIGTRMLTCYLFCSSMLHWSMFTVYCFTSKSVQLEDVCLSLLVIGINCRFYIMMYKRKIFASMFNECRALWDFCTKHGQRTVMLYERKIRLVYQMFFYSSIGVNVMYPVDALITRLPPLEPNGTERRILPFNWFADNTENNWPGYWTTFVLQIFLVQHAIMYATACDTSGPLLMMISSGYFKHLRDRLSGLHKNRNLRKLEQIRCIIFHQRLLAYTNMKRYTRRFCSKLAKFADTMLLTQVLSTGYNISMILIKLVSSDRDKYKYVPILCVFVCQLYMIQWAPDHLHDESEGAAFAAYSAYVETLDSRDLNKRLLTIITRSQQPVQIMAGGFIPLSLESFGNMMKNAFSFFTVLRNFDL